MPAASTDVADRLALRSLVDAYATHADRRDYDAFVGLFTPDGVIALDQGDEDPLRFAGPEGLRAAATPLDQYPATMHLIANHVCDAGAGTGTTYCLANHLREREGGGMENFRMTIRYDDRYVRTDDGWRFASRHLDVLWTEAVPAEPGPLRF